MTTPEKPERVDDQRPRTCCGGSANQRGEWTPKKGAPQVLGCELCTESGRYWRDSSS